MRASALARVAFVAVLAGVFATHSTPRLSRSGVPAPGFDLLVLGDSVAAGSGDESGRGLAGFLRLRLASLDPHITNAAIPGARTGDVRRASRNRLLEVRRADVIVLSIGGNDLFGSAREQLLARALPRFAMWRASRRVAAVVDDLRSVNASATIILLGLYNPYARTSLGPWVSTQVRRWDARLMAIYARQSRVVVLPIADVLAPGRLSPLDRFHPGSAGYDAIVRRIVTSSVFASPSAR